MRIVFLLLAIPCFASDYYRQVILQTPGLVSYWRLDESSGDFADLKGGNTATSIGGITYSQTGPITGDAATAVLFNGSTGNASIANSTPFAFDYNTPFTVEAWYKQTGSSSNVIFSKMQNSGTFAGYELAVGSGNLHLFLINNFGSALMINKDWTTTSFSNGVWYHIVFTYDGSHLAAGCVAYVNGVLQTGAAVNDSLGSNSITTATSPYIGSRGGSSGFLNGQLANLAIYDRVLTSTEIAQHYNYGQRSSPMSRSTSAPLNVLLDNDSAGDRDNIYELQGFLRLAQLGYWTVVGYINVDGDTYGAPCMEAIFNYSGFAPTIGTYQGAGFADTDNINCAPYAAAKFPGKTRFDYPTDAAIYRQLLTAAPNGSITLILAGSPASLYNFMTDGGSPSAVSLITDKVVRTIWVGGIYATGCEYNFGCASAGAPSVNRTNGNYVLANWPASVPLDFVGIELGDPVIVLGSDNLYSRPNGSPFYTLTYSSRPDWGSLGHYAAIGTSYLTVASALNGSNAIDSTTGVNTWTSTPAAGMQYMGKAVSDAVLINLGNFLINDPSHPWGATW